MVYFLKGGSVEMITLQELLMKSTKELKYVHYLLKPKNQVYVSWSNMILNAIRKRIQDGSKNYDGNYAPLYISESGQEVEMQKNSAVKELVLGTKQLTLNPNGKELAYLLVDDLHLPRSSIQVLRAAIYQINEEDEELKGLKKRLIQILNNKEEELLDKFLKTNLFYFRITDTAVEYFDRA